MTDRERYKRTFSRLHASEGTFMEVASMKKIKIMPIRRLLAVAAAAVLVAAMATVAYANDVGGIRRHFQIWLSDGTPVEVEINLPDEDMPDGEVKYTASFKDDNGNDVVIFGEVASGEAGEADGEMDAESMKALDIYQVEYRDDGSVWVHYNGRDIEITNLFEKGVCYLELENEQIELEDGEESKSTYLVIQYGEGEGFASTGEFIASYSRTVDIP